MGMRERIEALQKLRDARRPSAGVLIQIGDDEWLTISTATLNNHQLTVKGKAAALAALSDCRKIYDHSGREDLQKGNNT